MQQYRALVLVTTQGPMRSSDLADSLGVLPSGLTRIVNRLIRDGFAEKNLGVKSRREVIITATPDGFELVRSALQHRRQELRDIVDHLSPSDRQVLVRAANALAGMA